MWLMVSYRTIRVPELRKLPLEGWAVERSALGEIARIVSQVYANKSDAQAETFRLRILQAGAAQQADAQKIPGPEKRR